MVCRMEKLLCELNRKDLKSQHTSTLSERYDDKLVYLKDQLKRVSEMGMNPKDRMGHTKEIIKTEIELGELSKILDERLKLTEKKDIFGDRIE